MSSAFCFNLDQSNILLSGNGLTLYQTTKLELDQTESINFADDKFIVVKIMISLWEKEKMLFTSIFSFSLNVFKRLFIQGLEVVIVW